MPLSPPNIPIPPRPLAARLVGSLVCSCIAATGLVTVMLALGATSAELRGPTGTAAAMGAGCVLVGGMLGLAVMLILSDGTLRKAPTAVFACSGVRMFASLGCGLVVWLTADPLAQPFWLSFLAASLAALTLETLVSVSAFKRATATNQTPAHASTHTHAHPLTEPTR